MEIIVLTKHFLNISSQFIVWGVARINRKGSQISTIERNDYSIINALLLLQKNIIAVILHHRSLIGPDHAPDHHHQNRSTARKNRNRSIKKKLYNTIEKFIISN